MSYPPKNEHVLRWIVDVESRIEDRTGFNTAARGRPVRQRTRAVIVHGIGDGERSVVGDTFEEVERFFLRDPEGVSTTTIPLNYTDRVPIFKQWWVPEGWPKRGTRNIAKTNIPKRYRRSAIVPYHFCVDGDRIAQWLPWEAIGSHTRGMNSVSIAVAIMRDIRSEEPISGATRKSLCDILTYCDVRHGGLECITHDEADRRTGHRPKGCPGVDIGNAISWAMTRGRILRGR